MATTVTSTGYAADLLNAASSGFDDSAVQAESFFEDHFSGLVNDIFDDSANATVYTASLISGSAYGGIFTVRGSGFTSYSGSISHVEYSGDGGSFSLDGALRWDSDYGITSGRISYVETHDGSNGYAMQGNFTLDSNGNAAGTMTREVIYSAGIVFEMTGSINIATLSGTVSKLYLHDDAGNSFTMTGSYSASVIEDALDNAGLVTNFFDAPALFTGNDTISAVDGLHGWHGYAGSDKLTGGILNDTFYGDDGNDVLMGNSGFDSLDGGAGDDTLDGGVDADSMTGGTGNDVYIVDNTDDKVYENDGEGTDLVKSSASFDLSINGNYVENLTLTGTAAINAFGNDLDNTLTGNSGANTLDGGAGADKLIGGAGNDVYIVDDARDVITDSAGIDTVQTYISYALPAGIEVLQLMGSDSLSATGNSTANTLIGNDGDNRLDGGAGNDTMTGGLGDDTYVISAAGDVIHEDASGGTDTVLSAVTYTLGANLENLTLLGTAALNASGNALDNLLVGNSGANTLNGGDGVDTLQGGLGNDVYIVDTQTDVLQEDIGGGIDTVRSSGNFMLADNVENLILTVAGHTGIGNALVNTITGTAGDDTLDGGAGADKLIGGAGNDVYIIDDAHDAVTDTLGTDTARSSVSWTLSTGLEIMVLTGVGSINATGNTLNNLLYGNDGNNTLDGGTGNDTMWGGLGDDVYVVNAAGDVIHEDANGGVDTVMSSVSVAALDDNLENIILTGKSAINAMGNDGSNTIIGNDGANTLDGHGGADALVGSVDTLIGGLGNDTYVIDSHDVILVEGDKGGTDTVRASVDYLLENNFENLVLLGDAVSGTGNSAVNTITGNGGDNWLDGMGGADVMVGGLGNDHYVVDNLHDKITEGTNAGIDTVSSGVDWTLGSNLENLDLTGGAIFGHGNALNNIITGNAGANNLQGLGGDDTLQGGLGADTLSGGTGADTFVISHTDAADVITDFSLAQHDSIDLRDVLEGHDNVATMLADLVHVTTSGTGSAAITTISVDVDGLGHYADVAVLQHVSATLQSLLDAQAIIVQ
ncbi:MAG: type I secretion C-terminal target domain-containing protein [Micavibrio sp.]|nr:type I secretion C-terminal target domain-containing protein [Micavibrio sp.]